MLRSGYTESLGYNTAEGCTTSPRVLAMKCDEDEETERGAAEECNQDYPYRDSCHYDQYRVLKINASLKMERN